MVGKLNAPNREAIERYGRTEVLAEIPTIPGLGPESVEELADGLAKRLSGFRDAAQCRVGRPGV